MREIRPSGSVRGVRRKPYPYRDTTSFRCASSAVFGDASPRLILTASQLMQSSFGTHQNGKVRQRLPDEIAHSPVKLK